MLHPKAYPDGREDFGALIDRLTAQRATPASPPGCSALRPRSEARPRHLPGVPREFGRIPKPLLEPLRAVTTGKAPWPLVLSGPPGCGKTCAALCLLDWAGGYYAHVVEFLDLLVRAGKGEASHPDRSLGRSLLPATVWDWIDEAPLVVLDEIGARDYLSDFHAESVRRVIDRRYGKPLVVISNLTLPEIGAAYDLRLLDRLAAGTCVELVDAPSQRRQKNSAAAEKNT